MTIHKLYDESIHTDFPLAEPTHLKFTDRTLLVALESFKEMGFEEASKCFADGRKLVWWIQSVQFLSEKQPSNKAPSYLDRLYRFANGLLSGQIIVWAPISILDRYGRGTLGSIAVDVVKKGEAFTSLGFTELDFFVKVVGLLQEGKKDVQSLEFLSKSCLVARAASNYLGYSHIGSLFGLIGGGLGMWTTYKSLRD